MLFLFFKQKTAYEMRISDWSSDVCSSDLVEGPAEEGSRLDSVHRGNTDGAGVRRLHARRNPRRAQAQDGAELHGHLNRRQALRAAHLCQHPERVDEKARVPVHGGQRSEEHTSELQSLMRSSYDVLCL